MNPAEAVLYPSYYYRDMAFFLTKSITRIFTNRCSQSDKSIPVPPPLPGARICRSSDDYFMEFALDEEDVFDSDWEERLYCIVLRTIQLSSLDESVPIGTVVLLEMLNELGMTVRKMAPGKVDPCFLPHYPHPDYFIYFMGAFMLSYRTLNQSQQRLTPEFWEKAMGGMLTKEKIMRMEKDFAKALLTLVNIYSTTKATTPSSSSPVCDAYLDNTTPAYAGDEIVCPPTNTLIAPTEYTKAKRTMYAFIRVRMTSRGQEPVYIDMDAFRGINPDFALSFPPCSVEMQERSTLLTEVKRLHNNLWILPFKEVFECLMGAHDRTDDVYEDILMAKHGLVESALDGKRLSWSSEKGSKLGKFTFSQAPAGYLF